MVTFNRSKMPFPPRYRCKFEMDYQVYIANGVASTGYFTVAANAVYQPLSPAPASGGHTVATSPFNLLTYTTASMPQGVSNLLNTGTSGTSGVYDSYRVYASKIEIEAAATDIADTGFISVVPYIYTSVPSSFSASRQDRFQRECAISVFPGKSTKVSNFVHVWNVLGVSKTTYMTDVSGQYSSVGNNQPANGVGFVSWYVGYQMASDADNSADIMLRVKQTFYTELWTELASLEKTT